MTAGSKAALDNRVVNGASWTRKHCMSILHAKTPYETVLLVHTLSRAEPEAAATHR
jgi:hypothetical protein